MSGDWGCKGEAKVYYPKCNNYIDTNYIILCQKCKDLNVYTSLIEMTEEQINERFNLPIKNEIEALESRAKELKKQLK